MPHRADHAVAIPVRNCKILKRRSPQGSIPDDWKNDLPTQASPVLNAQYQLAVLFGGVSSHALIARVCIIKTFSMTILREG